MKSFGDRLKFLRGAASQAEMAAKLGIPQMTLSNYETGKSEPKFVMIQKMCSFFMVGADWLLFGNGPMRLTDRPQEQQHVSQPKATPALAKAADVCPQCVKLEMELTIEKQERRELTLELRTVNTQNRQRSVEMEYLLRENGELKEQCAILAGKLRTQAPGGDSRISYTPFNNM